MFPFTSIFTRRYRPGQAPRRDVLDEEYEWVFGRKAASTNPTNHQHPAEDRRTFEQNSN